jgi:hypothetical protein
LVVFPSRQVRRECGQGLENARPAGCREASVETQTLIQGRCGLFSVPLMGCASLVDSACDVGLTRRGPVSGNRCRQRAARP